MRTTTAQNINAQNITASNLCYSNGTNCENYNASYVPYTGATTNVSLGNNYLTFGRISNIDNPILAAS
jgi:hypothetical protein